jgi:hypothetical protein
MAENRILAVKSVIDKINPGFIIINRSSQNQGDKPVEAVFINMKNCYCAYCPKNLFTILKR